MRYVVPLAILAVVLALRSSAVRERFGLEGGRGATPAAAGQLGGLPPELRSLYGSGAKLPVGGASLLPGFFGRGARPAGAPPPRPFADSGPPRAVAAVKRDVRRHLDTVSFLASRRIASRERGALVLRLVYSAGALRAAGADGREELARRLEGVLAGGPQRLRVAAFQGVAVVGSRAVAVLDYRRSVRAGRRWRELRTGRWQVALVREGRAWRIVQGLEG